MPTPRTISAAARALRNRETTAQALVAEALARIDKLDGEIHAWVLVDCQGAERAAAQADREITSGQDRGLLHGIPIGVKDIVDVQGMPTRAGSTITSSQPARVDASIVERLRAAGAIILGKTVTTEFACFDPSSTRNPWNTAHTPGGSSSGSAAAVALEMCFAAIASQTGGSITRPASYCGVAGCKPTFGRVSRRGIVPVSFHLDHVGAMARTVDDLRIMLAAIEGDDPQDPGSVPHELLVLSVNDVAGATAGSSSSAASKPPRLGVLRDFFFSEADREVAELTEQAVSTLAGQGATIVELPLPAGFDQVHVMHRRVMAAEAADFHRRTYGAPRSGYGPNMASLLAEGFGVSMADYQEGLVHQQHFASSVARTAATVDVLLTPATPTAAPASLATTGDPRFNSPWSHAGVPTVSFPFALTSARMPIALQLIGPAWSEAKLLDVATWCEMRIQLTARPVLVG